MPRYVVHVYPIIRVTTGPIEAADAESAIHQADEQVFGRRTLAVAKCAGGLDVDTEDVTCDGYVVDELGPDGRRLRSRTFDRSGRPTGGWRL